MKAIKNFEEFVKANIAKKQGIDRSRADFLINESERDYHCLLDIIDKLKVSDLNANLFIKSCYDLLMESIRAKMLLDGYNSSGQGAHEAEVSYLRILGFNEADVQFADQLRFFRNGMLYYGTILNKDYAVQVIEFTKKIYPKLKEIINKRAI